MAPGAKVLYVGGKNCTVSLYNAVEEVVDGHLASIVTNSWTNGPEEEAGETDQSREAFNHVLLMAAGTGVGVQFSAGDEGDNFIVSGEQQPSFPATSPYATAVGGTSVEIGAQNNRLGEVGWSTGISTLCTKELAELGGCETSEVGQWDPEAPGEYDYGGGGGTSNQYPEPWYQEAGGAARNSPRRPGRASRNRVIPDISMEGDPSTGMLVGETQEFADGTYYDQYRIGGTSLSSPLFAGADGGRRPGGPRLARIRQSAALPPRCRRPEPGSVLRHPPGRQSGGRPQRLPERRKRGRRHPHHGEDPRHGRGDRVLLQKRERRNRRMRTGELEEAPESLSAAPGFDSMTGIGSPGDQFISELIRR